MGNPARFARESARPGRPPVNIKLCGRRRVAVASQLVHAAPRLTLKVATLATSVAIYSSTAGTTATALGAVGRHPVPPPAPPTGAPGRAGPISDSLEPRDARVSPSWRPVAGISTKSRWPSLTRTAATTTKFRLPSGPGTHRSSAVRSGAGVHLQHGRRNSYEPACHGDGHNGWVRVRDGAPADVGSRPAPLFKKYLEVYRSITHSPSEDGFRPEGHPAISSAASVPVSRSDGNQIC